jgi:carbonic anhydrase/acetyltransferase-like protein (isoleucine patch superfamily)
MASHTGPTEPTPATAAPKAPATAGGPRLLALGDARPDIADDAFLAAGATVIGQVTLAARSSVWYGAVLRGDAAAIHIGEQSNVQDGTVVHADPGFPAIVGDRVTVGHGVVIHGCRIDGDVLVGMGAVVMNGAHIGSGSVIAAGAVVTQGTEVSPGSLVAGVPAKVIRRVGDAERELITSGFQHYVERAELHRGATPL